MRRTTPALALVLGLVVVATSWAGEVRVYANREIKPVVLQLISQAHQSLDIQMYTLTDQEVIRSLQTARTRGVVVRVFLDASQPSNKKNVPQLINKRIEVKWSPLERPALMHRKLLIVDGREVLLGSCNWTHNAFTRSDEVDVWLDDTEAVARLVALFDDDWTSVSQPHATAGRKNIQGKLDAEFRF